MSEQSELSKLGEQDAFPESYVNIRTHELNMNSYTHYIRASSSTGYAHFSCDPRITPLL